MTPNEGTANSKSQKIPGKTPLGSSYYGLLGLHPSASPIEIRRSYRERSKLYHPDTTDLPPAVATAKFQQLNNAYATLSNPERRLAYDLKIGYSRLNVIQSPPGFNTPVWLGQKNFQLRLPRPHGSTSFPRRNVRPVYHGS